MNKKEKENLIEKLETLMANTLVMKLKTQYFHHHVQGLHFNEMHDYFQDLYEELEMAYDEIGEQIRMLGEKAPGSLSSHRENTSLNSVRQHDDYNVDEMVNILFNDNDTIRDHLTEYEKLASNINAENVLDFFVERHRAHDKHHYFLGSLSQNL